MGFGGGITASGVQPPVIHAQHHPVAQTLSAGHRALGSSRETACKWPRFPRAKRRYSTPLRGRRERASTSESKLPAALHTGAELGPKQAFKGEFRRKNVLGKQHPRLLERHNLDSVCFCWRLYYRREEEEVVRDISGHRDPNCAT